MNSKKSVFAVFLLILISAAAQAQDQHYKVTLLRANPGDLLELIDVLKDDIENHESLGIQKPYLLRHSQGDHWDLMMIYPVDRPGVYFSDDKVAKREMSNSIEKSYGDSFFDLVSFQEEAIVAGPDLKRFEDWFETYSFFHIEIFTALAGKQAELLKQRQDENRFYENLEMKPNFIFTRVFGPSWDIFTIGAYKSLQDFAAGTDHSFEEENRAAIEAGFEGVNFIGSYLRSLLLRHHDTLANKVQ